jgi:putative ABC transport system permease protein
MVKQPNGREVTLGVSFIDFDFLELYGQRPLAGRFFQRDHPADETAMPASPQAQLEPHSVVLNETAVRTLGLGSPAEAIGKTLTLPGGPAQGPQVIGVAPDFSIDLLHGPVRPTAYLIFAPALTNLSVKLDGQRLPETLSAIDRLWRDAGPPRAIQRRFLDQYLQTLYVGTIREGVLVAALSCVAIFIACLGLFGLAAFTAERRTKEIGVRKAMGASRTDIVGLLLWQFTKPVLWANLIAWPVAWWFMSRWLQGFGTRISLGPGLFVLAAVAAVLIAWATVLAHAVRVAGAKPVRALRYE